MTSERFPPVKRAGNHSLGEDLDTYVQKTLGGNPGFKYKDNEGNPIGPFAIFVGDLNPFVAILVRIQSPETYRQYCKYTPSLFPTFMAHLELLLKESTFEPRPRELAVLAVTSVFKAPYVAYAHRKVGAEQGLSELQIDQALEGLVPEELSEEDQVVYQTALALVGTLGPLDQKTWDKAEKVLGREKVAKLGMIVGLYVQISVLLNLGAVGSPTE